MEFYDVVKKRRSIRKYKDMEVSDEILNKILEIAFYSPSGRNQRPWYFVVVKDRNKIERIKNARPSALGFLETAPVVIVVLLKETSTWICDGAIVAEHIQLAATNFGLGACWGHVENRYYNGKSVENEIKKIINAPRDLRVLCVIALGYPDEIKSEHDKSEFMKDRVFYNEFST